MSDAQDEKIMGIVPKARYMYFAYMFLLVSAAGNALFSVFGILGFAPDSAAVAVTALGLLAVILAAVGLTKHKDDFTALDHAHFKYIAAMFLAFLVLNLLFAAMFQAFLVLNLLFGGVYGISYALGYLCTIALGLLQAVLVWTGYNSWQGGRVVTKDNIKSEVQIAIKNR